VTARFDVMLMQLQPQEMSQGLLDLQTPSLAGCGRAGQAVDKARLITAVDSLNRRYGRGSVLLASAGVPGQARDWVMR
jgi:DNA polymerase V